MPWITTVYHPGFAEDLTCWETRIDREGKLLQIVEIYCFQPRVKRTEELHAQLTASEVAELARLVDATDFAAVAEASQRLCVDDVESIFIQVDGPPKQVIRGPLFYWRQLQKERESLACPALADAIRLWQAIDRLSPYRKRK